VHSFQPVTPWCPGPLEGGGEQVAGRQAAVGPPSVGDGQDLLLGGEVVELAGDLEEVSTGVGYARLVVPTGTMGMARGLEEPWVN
jgi:hypothetical protein